VGHLLSLPSVLSEDSEDGLLDSRISREPVGAADSGGFRARSPRFSHPPRSAPSPTFLVGIPHVRKSPAGDSLLPVERGLLSFRRHTYAGLFADTPRAPRVAALLEPPLQPPSSTGESLLKGITRSDSPHGRGGGGLTDFARIGLSPDYAGKWVAGAGTSLGSVRPQIGVWQQCCHPGTDARPLPRRRRSAAASKIPVRDRGDVPQTSAGYGRPDVCDARAACQNEHIPRHCRRAPGRQVACGTPDAMTCPVHASRQWPPPAAPIARRHSAMGEPRVNTPDWDSLTGVSPRIGAVLRPILRVEFGTRESVLLHRAGHESHPMR
jgi:hypothetical protein